MYNRRLSEFDQAVCQFILVCREPVRDGPARRKGRTQTSIVDELVPQLWVQDAVYHTLCGASQ